MHLSDFLQNLYKFIYYEYNISMNIFITGTNTDIGKTYVTAGLALALNALGKKVGVYKPIQSGATEKLGELSAPDLDYITKLEPSIATKCTYLLKPATAPKLAAKIDGVQIDIAKIKSDYEEFSRQCDIVITEGAGGMCVPIADDFLISNLIKLISDQVILVASAELGTINHILLTLDYAKNHNINVIGTIINKYPKGTKNPAVKNIETQIAEFTDIPILGILNKIEENADKDFIIKHFLDNTDLKTIFDL